MRFRNDIYEKLYPRTPAPEVIESAVESFTPTQDIINESNNQPEGGTSDGIPGDSTNNDE